VIAVSCFEIARRDANVYFLFLVVGSAGCHFGFVYTMLSVRHFLASGQLAGFWQLHIILAVVFCRCCGYYHWYS
jgi:hypothetical protein